MSSVAERARATSAAVRPTLRLLDEPALVRILGEAHALLREPGVRVHGAEARELLRTAGARVDDDLVRIPPELVRDALATVPCAFDLFDRAGRPAVRYGAGLVHFDPGSCGVQVLDPETGEHRPSTAADLVRIVQVAEALPAYAAQSTAVVCGDVPASIGDLYRLGLVLLHADKPVVTGTFTVATGALMLELLAIDAGGSKQLAARPRAVFDVCPSPPLAWAELAAHDLVMLARAGVPAQIVSMPLAGAAAPVTLAGSVVQHAAECLSGIVIHQLARPGAPIVWGGAPAIVDMRTGATPMGAVETHMLDAACAEVGRSLGLPTHGYLGATDGKLVDAQAGAESAAGFLVAALSGIDMVSGAGMLDFLLCQSPEKLVLDAEAIGSAQRLVRGLTVDPPPATLALDAIAAAGPAAAFLELPETGQLFRREQHLPSRVTDRASHRAWLDAGGHGAFERARQRVDEIVASARPPAIAADVAAGIAALVRDQAALAGLAGTPGIADTDSGTMRG